MFIRYLVPVPPLPHVVARNPKLDYSLVPVPDTTASAVLMLHTDAWNIPRNGQLFTRIYTFEYVFG